MPVVAFEAQVPCQGKYVCDLAELGGLELYVPASYADAYPPAGSVYDWYEGYVYLSAEEEDGETEEHSWV